MGQWSIDERPHKLDDLYGCDDVKKFFKKAAKTDTWPTAALFQGRFGCGKTTSAMIVAQMMVCTNPDSDGNPCGECPSCKAIVDGKFDRDVQMIDGGQTGKDDIIETVTKFIATAPMKDKRKVMIIEEFQELSDKAKNSLLKILESPKENRHFLFTTMAETLKATGLTSRCQIFKFKYATALDIMYYLKSCLEKIPENYDDKKRDPTKKVASLWDSEKIPSEFKMQGLAMIAQNCDGSCRQAIQMMQKCINVEAYTVEEIRDVLGIVDIDKVDKALMAILDGKGEEAFETLVDNDYNASFVTAYKLVSNAEQYRTFGKIATWIAPRENSKNPIRDHNDGSKVWYFDEEQAAIPMAKHHNFSILLNGFKEISTITRFDYLKKSDYVISLCEIIRLCKGTPKVEGVKRLTEAIPSVRRVAPQA